jgi:hypothetical protein
MSRDDNNGQGNNGNGNGNGGGSDPPIHSDACSCDGCCEVRLIVGVLKATRPRFAIVPAGSAAGRVVIDPSTKELRDKAIAAAMDLLP